MNDDTLAGRIQRDDEEVIKELRKAKDEVIAMHKHASLEDTGTIAWCGGAVYALDLALRLMGVEP